VNTKKAIYKEAYNYALRINVEEASVSAAIVKVLATLGSSSAREFGLLGE